MKEAKKEGSLMSGVISVIVFQEEGMWVARGLEVDIVAQAKTLERLPYKFALAFASSIAVREAEGLDPFEGMQHAPSAYWERHRKGIKMDDSMARVPVSVPDAPRHMIPAVDMRMDSQAAIA